MVVSLDINELLKPKTKCLTFGSKSDPTPLNLVIMIYSVPKIFIKLINNYFCDFCGSNLWNLFGKAAEKLYTM